jgi:hypothetical protein
MKINEYQIICGRVDPHVGKYSEENLNLKLREMISEGWQPYFAPFYIEGFYGAFQGMVKYEKDQDNV